MVIDGLGRIGMGVTNPTAADGTKRGSVGFVVPVMFLSYCFTNTAVSGDFRMGGDGGDIYWQVLGGRALQMGSYYTTLFFRWRQTNGVFPATLTVAGTLTNTRVLVRAQKSS